MAMKKSTFKKLVNNIIISLLVLILITPQNISVSALTSVESTSDYNFFDIINEWVKNDFVFDSIHFVNLDNIVFLIPEYFDEYKALRIAVESLSPKALDIFESFLSTDEQALETHLLHVNSTFQVEERLIVSFNATVHQQIMNNLSSGLITLTLTQAMRNLLMSVASAILTHPVITGTVVLTVLTGIAFYATFVGSWKDFSSVWSSIISVFSSAFAPLVNSTVINTGFNNANNTFTNAFNSAVLSDLSGIARRHATGQCVAAANAMMSYLRNRNLRGTHIRLNFTGSINGTVFSLTRNIPVGWTGFHEGVSFNSMTFCPAHPNGLIEARWIVDFVSHFPHGNGIIERPTSIIIRTPI